MYKKSLPIAVVCIANLLSGCVTPPPRYALSQDQPYANLKSGISQSMSRHESIGIYVFEGVCGAGEKKSLFEISMSRTTPNDYVKVAAGKPLRLQYHENASGGRFCQVAIEVTLEPGKSYSVVGGTHFEKGLIPFLPSRMCQFGVVNDIDGSLLSTKAPCAK